MNKKIILTESKIRNAIKEALEDFGFDAENGEFNDYDTPQEKYRVIYHINKQISFTASRFDEKYATVAKGAEEFDSKEEAYEFFENLKNEYNDCYAVTLRIERAIDTLTGLSWDMVRDGSGWLGGRGMREAKSNVRHSDFYKEGNKWAMDIHDGENSSTVYASKKSHLKDEVKSKGYNHDNAAFDKESNFKKMAQTESKLRSFIKESVRRVLKEWTDDIDRPSLQDVDGYGDIVKHIEPKGQYFVAEDQEGENYFAVYDVDEWNLSDFDERDIRKWFDSEEEAQLYCDKVNKHYQVMDNIS